MIHWVGLNDNETRWNPQPMHCCMTGPSCRRFNAELVLLRDLHHRMHDGSLPLLCGSVEEGLQLLTSNSTAFAQHDAHQLEGKLKEIEGNTSMQSLCELRLSWWSMRLDH